MLEDKSEKKYPLIVYNHGMGYGDFENPTLWNELVKKGYVVIVLTHKYLSDNFRDYNGNLTMWIDNNFWNKGRDPLLLHNLTRGGVKDTTLALENLKKINEKEFGGKIGLDKYFAMGWSLGGCNLIISFKYRCKVYWGYKYGWKFVSKRKEFYLY